MRHLVKADAVGKVRVLLGEEVGVLLLESAVVHYVLGVADHVGDLICLRRKHYILQMKNVSLVEIVRSGC